MGLRKEIKVQATSVVLIPLRVEYPCGDILIYNSPQQRGYCLNPSSSGIPLWGGQRKATLDRKATRLNPSSSGIPLWGGGCTSRARRTIVLIPLRVEYPCGVSGKMSVTTRKTRLNPSSSGIPLWGLKSPGSNGKSPASGLNPSSSGIPLWGRPTPKQVSKLLKVLIPLRVEYPCGAFNQ